MNSPAAIPDSTACARCKGSGVVDDGEIGFSECAGIPYENGPIKCVKDCPVCGGRNAAAISAGTASVSQADKRAPSMSMFANSSDYWRWMYERREEEANQLSERLILSAARIRELEEALQLVASVQVAPGHGYDLEAMDEAIVKARSTLKKD